MTPEQYTDLGYAIFPCSGKRPARAAHWPNEEPFQPGDNIALVVPEGALVLDLDRKPDRDGVAELSSIAPAGWRYDGPRAVTGGGGLHLWFSVPAILGLGNGRGCLPAGIDVRGGGKGYVIAPPSVHPDTGAVYTWKKPLVPAAELPPAPQWLIKIILDRPQPAGPGVNKKTGELPAQGATPDRLRSYFDAVLRAEGERVRVAPDGQGNETINHAAFKMGQLAHLGLGYEQAVDAVAEAISGWSWKSPRDEKAAWRTFDSGWKAGEREPRDPPEDRPLGDHPNQPNGEDSAARPLIRIAEDERRVNDQAVKALAGAGYGDLFQRNNELVRVVTSDLTKKADSLEMPDTVVIRPMSKASVRETMADAAQWVKWSAKAERHVPAHPPYWSVQAVSDRGHYPGLPYLRGVASYPMLRPDGTISAGEGYDAQTGYFLHGLPDVPSLALEPEQAASKLLGLVSDFPFRSEVDRASWLAYLLTPLARACIVGPTPLFIVGANVRGSGKTLLADVAGYILTGQTLPAQTYAESNEELEKILVSAARFGLPVLCFDNVNQDLGGPVLDKWLTSISPTGRILGASEIVQFDWRTILVATVNNASIHGDTDRRSIYVNLETEEERPELRTGFQIPDLPGYLRTNRGEILSWCLAILQGYHKAGMPQSQGRAKGSFEGWARWVRDAVMWAGLPDAERAPDDPDRPDDVEADELGALLSALYEHYQGAWFTVAEILNDCYGSDLIANSAKDLRDVLGMLDHKRDRPSRQMVGKRLRRYRNRWHSDKSLDSVKDRIRNIQSWRIITR